MRILLSITAARIDRSNRPAEAAETILRHAIEGPAIALWDLQPRPIFANISLSILPPI